MANLGGCWWTLKVKISFVNCWLAKCCLATGTAWDIAASRWHESLKPLEPVEDTDTFAMGNTTIPHEGKVK